jgi:hypothetical protein
VSQRKASGRAIFPYSRPRNLHWLTTLPLKVVVLSCGGSYISSWTVFLALNDLVVDLSPKITLMCD